MREVFIYKGGIGDALFVGTLAMKKAEESGKRIWVYTYHPEMFDHPDVIAIGLAGLIGFRYLAKFFPRHFRCRDLYYTRHFLDNPQSNKHILDLMAEKAGVHLDTPAPRLTFLPAEYKGLNTQGKRIIAIHSTGSDPRLLTKFYFPDRFAQVVLTIKSSLKDVLFVQLGLSTDPLLEGVDYDLRGKTTLRESVAVLKAADLFVGQVGFLMHASRAVQTPSVIVFGGREKAAQSGYPENINLETDMHCSPCWAYECPYDRACMKEITAEKVVVAVMEMLNRIPVGMDRTT